MNWNDMSTAPRDGTEFVWVRRITVVAVGKPTSYRYESQTLRRFWLGDVEGKPREGDGFWMSQWGSVPDHDATGWWAPLPADGVKTEPRP